MSRERVQEGGFKESTTDYGYTGNRYETVTTAIGDSRGCRLGALVERPVCLVDYELKGFVVRQGR